MQRTKQQALFFLLGAVLVGGVLGFSAERVLHDGDRDRGWFRREAMYDDLSLTAAQRVAVDSVLDERHCQMRALMEQLEPQADSIKEAGRVSMLRILTPEQRDRFERRRLEMEARDAERRASRSKRHRPCP